VIDDIYLNSIKAKLAILGKIWKFLTIVNFKFKMFYIRDQENKISRLNKFNSTCETLTSTGRLST
jgi:hypothetical protein